MGQWRDGKRGESETAVESGSDKGLRSASDLGIVHTAVSNLHVPSGSQLRKAVTPEKGLKFDLHV